MDRFCGFQRGNKIVVGRNEIEDIALPSDTSFNNRDCNVDIGQFLLMRDEFFPASLGSTTFSVLLLETSEHNLHILTLQELDIGFVAREGLKQTPRRVDGKITHALDIFVGGYGETTSQGIEVQPLVLMKGRVFVKCVVHVEAIDKEHGAFHDNPPK